MSALGCDFSRSKLYHLNGCASTKPHCGDEAAQLSSNPSGRAILRNNVALLPAAKPHLEHDADTEVASPLFREQLPRPGETSRQLNEEPLSYKALAVA